MSEDRELPVCPECNGPMAVQYEVKIDPVKRAGGRDLPLGDRRDILTAWCPLHGGRTRFERVTPAGHPVEPMSFRVPERVTPAPRWHEIATDGLPPLGVNVLTWSESAGVQFATHELNTDADENPIDVWRDDHGCPAEDDITHWHPLPAPPTKEPR